MDLAEFYQTIASLNDAGMTATTVYLTVVSAYIIAAYVVGRELKKSQLVVISTLFVAFGLFFAFGSFRLYSAATRFALREDTDASVYPILAYIIFTVEILGIFAALKFMLDIRKDDSEN